MEEVPEAPGVDDVVVQTQVHGGYNTGNTCKAQMII